MEIAVFEKRLELCDRVCNYLDGKIGRKEMNEEKLLSNSFHYELMKFAIYLSDSDGMIETEEVITLRKLLKVNALVPDMRTMKHRERIPDGYLSQIPACIQVAVAEDEKSDLIQGFFSGQCAQILLDTYCYFGLFFIALHKNDPTDTTAKAYTEYVNKIRDYLKEHHVFVFGDSKAYPIEELEQFEQNKKNEQQGASASASEEEERLGEGISKDAGGTMFGVTPTENPVAGTEFENMGLDEKLAEFHDMIGLYEVKKEVDALINLIRIQKLRASYGLKNTETSKHMVFTGNPGTGKTTVARILASIYKDLGVLEKGTFIEVDRSGLVKGYVGQTAIQVKKVIEEAKGGILFIDEAYTLTVNRGENDYGQEAVDTILKAMEDMRDDLIIIVAGYPDLMEQFLESNPGLKSRFNKFIDFQDYTVDEEMQILEKMCCKQEYSMTNPVKNYVHALIEKRLAQKEESNANARDVRNMLENAIMRQATRLISAPNPTKEMLTALEIADFTEE